MTDKWVKELREELEAQSFEVTERTKGWMVKPPDPEASLVMLHLTNSDHRSRANAIAALKRSGFLPRRK
ncbi:hypothetical protein [Curtobacterium sp. MCSS17_015]|uniref:hypothetical protein n=1 Tax=Curtobacterium sp. MCSS17_015 TaxID=2175666 RepID=UPI000DA90557|nr:hypothetical protein [Curtobacterium sp. MCSS17_015]WIB25396.1 hypothetical protein DEJ18_10035 [Curtobacterium sp. MCSS17_015]